MQKTTEVKNRLVTLVASTVVATALLSGIAAAPANAASGGCANGACTVYLTKAETQSLAAGRVPAMNLGALTMPYRVLAIGHVLIAKDYARRGMCVGFTLNVRPWATQGMFGFRC